MQRETSERGEQPQREGRDRGEGSEMASLQTSELDVLRTLDHQPQQANRSTELMRRRTEEDPYYRERSIAIERAIERARERRISRREEYIEYRERENEREGQGTLSEELGRRREGWRRRREEWRRRREEENHFEAAVHMGEVRESLEAPIAANPPERNPEREREPIENIVQTEMWKSKEVQD